MAITIPDPPTGTPVVDRETELVVQRKNTEWFIAWHPMDITLIPRIRVKSGTGSKYVDGSPRRVQRMRLIPQNETTRPLFTDEGKERVITHTLLGLWDADVAVGDHWTDLDGATYEVLDVATPPNGYETKAMIEQHGNR
jgi:hypothetical protein